MKNRFLFRLISLTLLLGLVACSGKKSTSEVAWQPLAGNWNITDAGITPVIEREPVDSPFLLVDHSMPWDTEWFSMSVDFSFSAFDSGKPIGMLLHVKDADDYELLRISRSEEGSTLQMLRWQYGYFRQWQEARFPALVTGKQYNLSIVRAPVIDREDWRPWKIIVTDKETGKQLHKEGIENHMPAFGLGITGLYSMTDQVTFSNYAIDRPVPENMSGVLRLPVIFANGMVLQRNQKNPVWGKAAPNADVEVKIAGQKHKAKVDIQGNWFVVLDPLSAQTGLVMSVKSGKDVLQIKDIAVGEVWFASGQSNMEMKTWESNVTSTEDPDIRLFTQLQWSSEDPMFTAGGRWQKSDSAVTPRWSAVAYAFAQELKRKLDVPVGIIGTYFGGTAIESWIPREELKKDPVTKPIYDRIVDAQYKLENNLPIDNRFPWVWDSPGHRHTPGDIYNAMVYPHMPYGIAGVVWYQGETSSSKAFQYGHLFPMLIDSWRKGWDNPELNFYFVQLAGYDGKESGSNIESAWPQLRDIQRRVLDQKTHTGMVVAFHLGDSLNIHPPYKLEVGTGLANLALHDIYGFTDIVRSGPLLDHVVVDGNRMVLTFRETGRGLASGDGKPLSEFLIAGDDQKFYPAAAAINPDGVSVTVTSSKVSHPVAVRYGWKNYTRGANLVNSAGLPAAMFRTDNCPLPTDHDL